jgi:hypothetical protein
MTTYVDLELDLHDLVTPDFEADLTIQQRYEQWRDANPWILPALARLLDDWSAHGGRRVGVKAATEWMRFFYARQINSTDFRINNSYTSRLARDLIAAYPHLAAVIETRELRAA